MGSAVELLLPRLLPLAAAVRGLTAAPEGRRVAQSEVSLPAAMTTSYQCYTNSKTALISRAPPRNGRRCLCAMHALNRFLEAAGRQHGTRVGTGTQTQRTRGCIGKKQKEWLHYKGTERMEWGSSLMNAHSLAFNLGSPSAAGQPAVWLPR